VRDRIERRELLRFPDGHAQASRRVIEVKLEERAARALDGERLLERVAIEVLLEFDQHRIRLSLESRHARRERGIAGSLLANARLVQGTARNRSDRLIERRVRF
jgi:hypothetical protein